MLSLVQGACTLKGSKECEKLKMGKKPHQIAKFIQSHFLLISTNLFIS